MQTHNLLRTSQIPSRLTWIKGQELIHHQFASEMEKAYPSWEVNLGMGSPVHDVTSLALSFGKGAEKRRESANQQSTVSDTGLNTAAQPVAARAFIPSILTDQACGEVNQTASQSNHLKIQDAGIRDSKPTVHSQSVIGPLAQRVVVSTGVQTKSLHGQYNRVSAEVSLKGPGLVAISSSQTEPRQSKASGNPSDSAKGNAFELNSNCQRNVDSPLDAAIPAPLVGSMSQKPAIGEYDGVGFEGKPSGASNTLKTASTISDQTSESNNQAPSIAATPMNGNGEDSRGRPATLNADVSNPLGVASSQAKLSQISPRSTVPAEGSAEKGYLEAPLEIKLRMQRSPEDTSASRRTYFPDTTSAVHTPLTAPSQASKLPITVGALNELSGCSAEVAHTGEVSVAHFSHQGAQDKSPHSLSSISEGDDLGNTSLQSTSVRSGQRKPQTPETKLVNGLQESGNQRAGEAAEVDASAQTNLSLVNRDGKHLSPVLTTREFRYKLAHISGSPAEVRPMVSDIDNMGPLQTSSKSSEGPPPSSDKQAMPQRNSSNGVTATARTSFERMDTSAVSTHLSFTPSIRSLTASLMDAGQGVSQVSARLVDGKLDASMSAVTQDSVSSISDQLPSLHAFMAEGGVSLRQVTISMDTSQRGQSQQDSQEPDQGLRSSGQGYQVTPAGASSENRDSHAGSIDVRA